MDILDRLVELAQVKGSVDVQCLFRGEWYVRHEPKRAHGLVHIVTAGSGYIRIDGEQEARLLSAGDIIFFPRSVGHTLSSDSSCENLGVSVLTTEKGAFKVKQSHAGGDAALHLFCARFEYEAQADIIAGLPDTVLLNINHPSLQYLVALLQYESGQALSGSVAVVNALASVLLVFLLRASLEKNGEAQLKLSGLLNGWQDKRLRNLLQAVVDKPEEEWNIEKMTAIANLSRAQLMRVFKQQTGTSPHAFVNSIRLQQGALLLKQTADSVLSVALSVGFQSETHFGKAFKKQYGISPGQYRKNDRADEPAVQAEEMPIYFI